MEDYLIELQRIVVKELVDLTPSEIDFLNARYMYLTPAQTNKFSSVLRGLAVETQPAVETVVEPVNQGTQYKTLEGTPVDTVETQPAVETVVDTPQTNVVNEQSENPINTTLSETKVEETPEQVQSEVPAFDPYDPDAPQA